MHHKIPSCQLDFRHVIKEAKGIYKICSSPPCSALKLSPISVGLCKEEGFEDDIVLGGCKDHNMQQDSFRSVVHRSLSKILPTRGKDEKETAQCGTNRRNKTSPAISRSYKNPNQTTIRGKEEETAMAFRDNNELQLLEVSMGAHNLTQMINSWSKAPNLDGLSKHFAEDLLRGAMDLQESLVMLEKFQAASRSQSGMSKKGKQEFMEGIARKGIEEVFHEVSSGKRFVTNGHKNRVQKQYVLVDEPSRNSVEEMKKVIKESLNRQNLLSLSSDDEKASSSLSLRYTTSNCSEAKSCGASTCISDQVKKTKVPNLIAKLMGLNEVSGDSHNVRKEEKLRSVSSPRAIFDIEMPKTRKLQLKEENSDPNKKALQDIIDTMHYKGLLKNSLAEDHRIQPYFLENSELEHSGRKYRNDDKAPPIVIMKPTHSPYFEREEIHEDCLSDKILLKEEVPSEKLVPNEKAIDHVHLVVRRTERNEVKSIEKTIVESPEDVKAPASATRKQKLKETIKSSRRLTEERKQRPVIRKKPEEKKDMKQTRMSTSYTKANIVTKPDRKLLAANKISSASSVSPNGNHKCPQKIESQNFTASTKEKKTAVARKVRNSIIIKKVTDDKMCKENGKELNPQDQNGGPSTENITYSCDNYCKMAEQDADTFIKDDISRALCEVNASQLGRMHSSGDEAIQLSMNKVHIAEASAIDDEMTLLLLSNQSFIDRVQEFLGLHSCKLIYPRIKRDFGIKDLKLYLDNANEQMTRKCQQKNFFYPPFLSQTCGRTIYFSLEDLLNNISKGIKRLTSYSKLDEDGLSKDNLYIKLERDLKCTDVAINSIWDIGWSNWICMEEADEVVSEVGEHILSLLIEEASINLFY
ncbi:uncharacterized protein [Typha angustifolia]|uniref:uncharacterized protein isoform X2 n=1 Tax=Typha angustifolia TaxID=59011 RepID=UPI003C2CD0EA